MGKPKRKLTAAERRARRERKKRYTTIFVNGKQKRVPRDPTIDGLAVNEFIRRNADPIWLVQNEMWEYLDGDSMAASPVDDESQSDSATNETPAAKIDDDFALPF